MISLLSLVLAFAGFQIACQTAVTAICRMKQHIVVAADVLEFVQGLTEWISYIMMLKYGGTSIGNESVTEPSRARADEKRRAEWLKPVRRHIIL